MKCRELAEFLIDYVSGDLPEETRVQLRGAPDPLPQLPRLLDPGPEHRQGGQDRVRRTSDELPTDVPEDLVKAVLAARRLI